MLVGYCVQCMSCGTEHNAKELCPICYQQLKIDRRKAVERKIKVLGRLGENENG